MKYIIQVQTIQNTTLTFTVPSYEIIEGDFVRFFDERRKEYKSFHASRCEIKEIPDSGIKSDEPLDRFTKSGGV